MLANDPARALEWLHSELGLSGDGHLANRPDLHGDLPRLAVIVGEGLAALHSVNQEDAPLETGWDLIAQAITDRLDQGLIDSSKLGRPYDGYRADRLVKFWREGKPVDKDLVVCCGNPVLSNLLIADSKLTGLVSAENAVIADRHLDLAIAQQSIHVELGSEAVFAFYEGYGRDANIVSLDHYVLASRLLGIIE